MFSSSTSRATSRSRGFSGRSKNWRRAACSSKFWALTRRPYERAMSILDRVPEYIRSLVPYEAGKPIEEVEREYGIEDSIKLASNENPLGPSPKALKALTERIGQLHLYPDGDSFYLKRALAARLSVAPDRLIFGNGSNELIELAVRTFLRPGDEAVIAAQAFVIYRLGVQAAGGACGILPLKNFTHDLHAISAAIPHRPPI